MSFSALVNLGTIGSGISGQNVSISGCTGASCGSGCTSLVSAQTVSSFPKTISNIPDNVVSLFVKVDGGSCAGTTQCITITTGTPSPTATATSVAPTPTATAVQPTPTATPLQPTPTATTVVPTPTPTPPVPTATETQYYLQLSRCDSAPNTVTGWTINSYTQSQITVGNIFYSAGGYYYSVINYQTTPPSPAGTIDGSKSNDYNTCDETPGHYVEPPPTPGQSILIHTGNTFGSSVTPCSMYESSIATNSTTVYLNGHNIPANGDYAFDSNLCVTTFEGDGNYYAALANSSKYAFTIGPTGYINNVTLCGVIPTATPEPTPAPTPTSPPLYGFFNSNPSATYNGHCNNNQLTSAPFYSISTTIPNMLFTTVYTDTNYTAWAGGSSYYAVSSDNTFNTNNPPYYVIRVDNNGLVDDVQYISSCTGGGAQN